MPRRHRSNKTTRKILESAGLLFSRKGFHGATIADICGMAGTNIASVNYHFGDKETLYVEAWRYAFGLSQLKYPPDGRVPPEAAPEERLRGWIVSTIQRVTDPDSYDFEIMHMELSNPTGLLSEAFRECVEPISQMLRAILEDLLGADTPEETIRLCEMSIQSQCMNPMIMGKRPRMGKEGRHPLPPPPILDTPPEFIAEHVLQFSLEGLAWVRRHLQGRRGNVKSSPGANS